ncbi:MAG: SIS domain-containing protein [Candidatus Paceibacterota bacterium]|jgi:glucosamine 6-phosphate synthetase-like amidotransferase/phosphosugar isomerase protein
MSIIIDSLQEYRTFLDNLDGIISTSLNQIDLVQKEDFKKALFDAKRIFYTGAGSSLPSALFGAQYSSDTLGLPAQFLPTGSILSMNFKEGDLVFLVTQGFNRGDSELIVKKVKKANIKLAVLTANKESPFNDFVDYKFYFSPFPEKLFCRPVGVQTSILSISKILTPDVEIEKVFRATKLGKKNVPIIFEKDCKYIVLSSGFGLPIGFNFALALREGCGIDAESFDIETYAHGMYVSDQVLKQRGVKISYLIVDLLADAHVHASCERIEPFIAATSSGKIIFSSNLEMPYSYIELLTYLAESVYRTNEINLYDMNTPPGKEENRYYHKAETYKL